MEIVLPYFTPRKWGIPLPFFASLAGAKQAGFDGVEIHLVGLSHAEVRRMAAHARRLGLTVSVHQAWSVEEDGVRHIWNAAFELLGWLPQGRDYPLIRHVPIGINAPVVIYADRMHEPMLARAWVQTCCHKDTRGQFTVPFERFLQDALNEGIPLVFDVQHVLEYALGVEGVASLPRRPQELWDRLLAAWKVMRPLVKEIHLADTDPDLGNSLGRNLPLGQGILPLRDFCQAVKESSWDGRVVPEVQPLHYKLRPRGWAMLRRQVAQLFA